MRKSRFTEEQIVCGFYDYLNAVLRLFEQPNPVSRFP